MTANEKQPSEQVTHIYDGIEEHDNPLPRWWLITFLGTIVFSVGYFYYFHTFGTGQTPQDELASEIAAEHQRKVAMGKAEAGVNPELLAAMARDQRAVDEGAATFASMCSPCHGAAAEGKIGPNLTDAFWIHGGKPEAIYKSIAEGVAAKGMPAWESSLGMRKTQTVTAYVLSLKGKNAPGGKEPQGNEEKEN